MPEPFDEPAAVPDVISSHEGGGFGAFAAPWRQGLVRLAFPLSRWRNAAAVGLGLAAVTAVAAVLLTSRSTPEQAFPVTTAAAGTAGSGEVFASGTADGHRWQLAVRDIAGPGYRCLPAITLDGTDADPVYPDPGNGADVTLRADPGVGFGFVQLPAGIGQLVLDEREVLPAVMVTACGERYRLAGFAFPLAQVPRITVVSARPAWPKLRMAAVGAPPGWPVPYQLPPVSGPPATAATPQNAAAWHNVSLAGAAGNAPVQG